MTNAEGEEEHLRDMQECPNKCSSHGVCVNSSWSTECFCDSGWTGADCSTPVCEEECHLIGGVCNAGVCEVPCESQKGYQCMNMSTAAAGGLDFCADYFDQQGAICAPTGIGAIQALEEGSITQSYKDLQEYAHLQLPFVEGVSCESAARELSCWMYLKQCAGASEGGTNSLRVCTSACENFNAACWRSFDCNDGTTFHDGGEGECTGTTGTRGWWEYHKGQLMVFACGAMASVIILRCVVMKAMDAIRRCKRSNSDTVIQVQSAERVEPSLPYAIL